MTNPGVAGGADHQLMQDDVLIRHLRDRGDERAFRELYRRHTPRMYQLVLRTLACEEDAEDVVQETWVRAVRSLDRFRGESRFSTWVTAIAVNLVGDRLRVRKKWVFEADALDSLSEREVHPGDAVDIERALELLPPGYRTVLLLHDVEGYKHEEIAEQLGIAIGTSKSQLFHARRALRERLDHVEEKYNAS